MSAFPPKFYLRAGERVRLEERMVPRWAMEVVASATLWGALVVAAALAFDAYAGRPEPSLLLIILASFAAASWILAALYAWRRIVTTEYVISEDTVYTRRGRILLRLNSAPLDRITDLHVHTSLLGRLFGYSGLVVRTAGGGLLLSGLRDAYGVRGVLHEQRRAYLEQLLRESGRGPKAGRAPAPTADQCRCPRCQQAIPVPRARPVAVVCPSCRLDGILFAEAAA